MHDVQSSTVGKLLPFRLAAIDIDDTLVGPDKVISEANRAAVLRLRWLGVKVVLASGRSHNNMLQFQRTLGLDEYIVSAQGALVKHPDTGYILFERSLGEAEAKAVVAEGIERGFTVLCFGHRGVYAQRQDHWTDIYKKDSNDGAVVFGDLANLPERNLLKVIWAADPKVIESVAPETAVRYAGRLSTCITNPY